jgi:hypothetical protein
MAVVPVPLSAAGEGAARKGNARKNAAHWPSARMGYSEYYSGATQTRALSSGRIGILSVLTAGTAR